jgi:hypothetical protein
LLDVIAGIDAFLVKLIAGVFDKLPDLLSAMVDIFGHEN